jgi:hypothetical protein
MRKFQEQVEAALKVYLDRGMKALALVEERDLDGLDDLLRRRRAAFHNYRVADAFLLADGIDIQSEPYFLDLLSQIATVDQRLKKEMENARRDSLLELRNCAIARRKITKFRSHKLTNSSINGTA